MMDWRLTKVKEVTQSVVHVEQLSVHVVLCVQI